MGKTDSNEQLEQSTSKASVNSNNSETNKFEQEAVIELKPKTTEKSGKCMGIRGVVTALVALLVAVAFFFVFIYPMITGCGGSVTKNRITEGLVLASSAKNLVVDNAVNGFPFNNGWDVGPFKSTENIESININPENGVILITATKKADGNRLVLTPYTGTTTPPNTLQPKVIPMERIFWRCYYTTTTKGEQPRLSDIPSECRDELPSHISLQGIN